MRSCFWNVWAVPVLLLATLTALAADRLVIDVSKVQRSSTDRDVVHYQGTGSVRHSEQRSYASAQSRNSARDAERREESQAARDRRIGHTEIRTTGQADSRSFAGATDRHGSVRLDTIR